MRPRYKTISLRRIYFHYFQVDIQSGVHNAKDDAQATMRCFRQYTSIFYHPENRFDFDIFDFKKFKK